MSIGQNQPTPLAPITYPIYRGFYVLPGDTISSLSPTPIQVNFFVARSTDNITWEGWTLLGQASSTSGFFVAHTGLDENTYYAYYCVYQYSDTSLGPAGTIVYPGRAQLIANSTLNIDQLASKAYSTGLVTAGTFRGIIFETSGSNPKVRMDPTGVFATNVSGAKTFNIDSTTGAFTAAAAGTATPVITAGIIQTATTGRRTVIDSTGLWVTIDNTNNKMFLLADNPPGLNMYTGGSTIINAINWYSTPINYVPKGGGFLVGQLSVRNNTIPVIGEVSDCDLGVYDSGGVSNLLSFNRCPHTDVNNSLVLSIRNAANTTTFGVNIFDGTGASDFLQIANNLSEVTSSTARNNLGLGAAQNVTFNQVTTVGNIIPGVNITFAPSGGGNIVTDTTTGTKIGTSATQKLGFFGAPTVVQPGGAGSGTTVAGTGATWKTDTKTDGGLGGNDYTVANVVNALKKLGLLA